MTHAWSAFYWRDYVANTGHLTLAQHGAYLLLMAHYYMTGRPIPANASVLHRVCRCTTDADRRAVAKVLAEFFTLEGDVYRHDRIDEELAKAVDISGKRRNAANARHQVSDANASVLHGGLKLQMHVHPQPQPQEDKKTSSEQKDRSDSLEISAQKKTSKPPSQEACRLAALLKTEILRNKNDYRITEAQERKWAMTADHMLCLDSRSPERIAELIRWVQHDEFWMANVLSMDTLRNKFDQLELKRAHHVGHGNASVTRAPMVIGNAVNNALALLKGGAQ